MHFPQLRVRSGYSFREVYGRFPEVLARLAAVNAPMACLVDTSGTWGHVKWSKSAKKAGINPGFGMEIPIICDETEDPRMFKFTPKAWILAVEIRSFYTTTTTALKSSGLYRDQFAELEGVIRFSGGAIDRLMPDDFDYVDINPSSMLLAAKGVAYARRHGKPMVITSCNVMPREDDANFAYSWQVRDTVAAAHIMGPMELEEALLPVMTQGEFDTAMCNTYAVANMVKGVELHKAPIINLPGDMVAIAREGAKKRLAAGHIPEWTQVYEDRFKEEVYQIQLKGFDSYFLCVGDLVQWAKKHMLVGPARGSSAGSLICYCMEITEVDPIPLNLLFQRFIDISREDFPDIDIDFPDTKRYMVYDYLVEKYGAANVSKMGNVNQLRSASTIAQVARKFLISLNETSPVRQSLIDYKAGDARYGNALRDTFDQTPAGESFKKIHPGAADCMADIELHPSHTGVHAAAMLVCNDPISDFCTVGPDGVAQIDKHDAEDLNLLKIDALGLRTLGVLEDAGVVTTEEFYALKMDDPRVFEVFRNDSLSGVFQFEGGAARGLTNKIHVDRFEQLDHINALARPGPLGSGMAQKYIERAAGREKVEFEAEQLRPFLEDTLGVFLYQEQIMLVVREIGGFDWARTSEIRKGMSKSKGNEFFARHVEDFVSGAVERGVNPDVARYVWEEMVTFGSYGFNKSHSASYAVVAYWCAWMKVYHPLQFSAAALRSAKDDEQSLSILRELEREGVGYTPIDTEHSLANWTVADGRLLGGITNAKGYGPVMAAKYMLARENGTLLEKQRERLAKAEIKFADLHEAHTKYGWAYDDPSAIGVSSGLPISELNEVEDRDECLVICKLVKKVLCDENDKFRLQSRGGKRVTGQTQFIDLLVIDDSVNLPAKLRIKANLFDKFGRHISENVPKGAWFLAKAWKVPEYRTFIVKNIKQIDDSREPAPIPVVLKAMTYEDEDALPVLEHIGPSEDDDAADYLASMYEDQH